MSIDLLRVAAEHGLLVTAGGVGSPRWRVNCPRCASWLEVAGSWAAPPVLLLRRVCSFAARHRHRQRRGGHEQGIGVAR